MSTYEVIARKWRPQGFDHLVGQEHVSQTLANALQNKRIPHALLFTGPRGTGKTSSARILAKALRCENPQGVQPCGECKNCKDIALGRQIDVIEIDGASNNGVDAIRELRDSVGYLPSSGQYKIYIIDEVHMLSTSAFNALLKTLEEPPNHVIFIMATTEVQKLPNTILSRCQRFDFRLIPQQKIKDHLQMICEKEQVHADDAALWLVAKQAKGSMRDAQSLLDQLITFSNGTLTADQVSSVLGLSPRELINESLSAFVAQDPTMVVPIINKLQKTGTDSLLFLEDLLEKLKNALLVKIKAHKNSYAFNIPEEEIPFLEKLTKPLSEEDLHLLFDVAMTGGHNLSRAMDPSLSLEMLLLKLTKAPRVQQIESRLQASAGSPQPVAAPAAPQKAKPVPAPRTASRATAQRPAPASPPTTMARPVATPAPAPPTPPSEAESLSKDPWHRFVEETRKTNGFMAALLEHTFIMEKGDSHLHLGLPKKMSFLLDKLNDPKNKERIEAFLKTHWGSDYQLTVELSDKKKEGPVTPKQKVKDVQQKAKEAEQQKVKDHPLMKKAQNLFKTEIVSIKEEKRQ